MKIKLLLLVVIVIGLFFLLSGKFRNTVKAEGYSINQTLEGQEDQLKVKKPLVWFQLQDAKLKDSRDQLLVVISKLGKIQGQCQKENEELASKEKGCQELVLEAEAVRETAKTSGWPIVFRRWALQNEEELENKIAELREAEKKSKAARVDSQAMLNKVEENLSGAKKSLKEFDEKYEVFKSTWKKVEVDETTQIPETLIKEINDVNASTKIFLDKWNKL